MDMRYTGILFDLFGTLVPPFRRREHADAIRECAEILEVGFDDCHRGWVETFPERIRGEFASVVENFDRIVRRSGGRADVERLEMAALRYRRFTHDGLVPVDGAVETLVRLSSLGVKIGLVTNCAPDIPETWSSSTFARYVDYCAFSCHVGAVKPAPELYRAALEALQLSPQETLYVGDGSDEELSGAARCGMEPVLVRVDLSNTYDVVRADVQGWSGRIVTSLREIPSIVEEAHLP
jgi:putative hydrolase of the HAD superfamily